MLSYFFKFISQGKEPDCWVVIADFNRKPNEEWRILKDFELYTQQLPPDEGKGKIIYYASLRCQRGTYKTTIINGKEVIATEFKFIYIFSTLFFRAGSCYPIKMSFDREEIQTYWLAKSIGVVQKEWTPPILYRIDSTLSVAHYRYELVDFAIK